MRENLCLWSVSGAARNETWHVDDNYFGTQRCPILSHACSRDENVINCSVRVVTHCADLYMLFEWVFCSHFLRRRLDLVKGFLTLLCVWDRPESPSPSGVAQGFSLIPVDSVGEVICEVEGEENTGGNGVEGTPDNDMTDEGMIFEKTHKDSSYLEPCEVRMSEMWHTQREKERVCASSEVLSVHPPRLSDEPSPRTRKSHPPLQSFEAQVLPSEWPHPQQQLYLFTPPLLCFSFPSRAPPSPASSPANPTPPPRSCRPRPKVTDIICLGAPGFLPSTSVCVPSWTQAFCASRLCIRRPSRALSPPFPAFPAPPHTAHICQDADDRPGTNGTKLQEQLCLVKFHCWPLCGSCCPASSACPRMFSGYLASFSSCQRNSALPRDVHRWSAPMISRTGFSHLSTSTPSFSSRSVEQHESAVTSFVPRVFCERSDANCKKCSSPLISTWICSLFSRYLTIWVMPFFTRSSWRVRVFHFHFVHLCCHVPR